VLVAGFIIVNAITVMFTYLFMVGSGFLGTFSLILFLERTIVMVFGGLLGTFLSRIMYYTPFGYYKGRDKTGKDDADEKRTYTGVPVLVLGIIIIVESVILVTL
jgi:hypothetical protein